MLNTFIKNRVISAFLALILSGVFISCREECHYKPQSLAGAVFHSLVEGSVVEAPVDNFSLSGIGREDSLLYDARSNIRNINLPMNGSAEESGFIFVFDEVTDTVWFSYEVVPWFLSRECGFILNFELLETWHTGNRIDSVVIVTREITTFDETNIRIYN